MHDQNNPSIPAAQKVAAALPLSMAAIGGCNVNAIDGRKLHAFLENKDHFSTWIQNRIDQFCFVEHRDFETFLGNPEKGRPSKEYVLSLDMAKELAMLERNSQGKRARLYFIEMERRAQDPVHHLMTMTRSQMLDLAAGLARDKEALNAQSDRQQATIAMLEPKAQFADRVTRSGDILSMREIGALIPGTTEPYQSHVDAGHFSVKEIAFEDGKGRDRVAFKTLITGRGQVWIQRMWDARKAVA